MNNKLIELRGKRSRKMVAESLGITSQGLAMIERGERFPRPALMKKFSDYYKKSVDELFFSPSRKLPFFIRLKHEMCQK